MDTSFLFSMCACIILVLLTVFVHYEALRLISATMSHFHKYQRRQILYVMVGIFVAHTVEVWLYALGFWVLDVVDGTPSFGGAFENNAFNYIYFSTVSYTSLGLGDVWPVGAMRLLTGVEALNGLILIAWSASFAYLVMERHWKV